MKFPDFDYDRAYDLSRSEEDEETEIPMDVLAAYRNAKNIAEASEDDNLIECLTCPYHYGIHKGDACDRDCYEAALEWLIARIFVIMDPKVQEMLLKQIRALV